MDYMQQYVKEQGDTSLCNVNKAEKDTVSLDEERVKSFPRKDMTSNAQLISESMQSPRCRQSHPSHAAEGVRWKGGRKVAVMRQEQLGVSSSGAEDLPQGLAVGYNREQRPDAALDVLAAGTAQAREEHKTPTVTPDM